MYCIDTYCYTYLLLDNFSDNLPTMVLKSWDLDVSLFDGDIMAGPIPTLFSDDCAASLSAILADPLKGHWDLMKIARCFLTTEALTLQEALAFVKKPKYEEAFTHSFIHSFSYS